MPPICCAPSCRPVACVVPPHGATCRRLPACYSETPDSRLSASRASKEPRTFAPTEVDIHHARSFQGSFTAKCVDKEPRNLGRSFSRFLFDEMRGFRTAEPGGGVRAIAPMRARMWRAPALSERAAVAPESLARRLRAEEKRTVDLVATSRSGLLGGQNGGGGAETAGSGRRRGR